MPQKEKTTILLVDDEEEVLKALHLMFRDSYNVITADSGRQSIEKVSNNSKISAVIMDIKMADMDGIDAARKIKNIIPDIPIIFHTGFPGDYDENEIDGDEKPFDYIEKLESNTKLVRSVRNAVEYFSLKKNSLSLTEYAEAAYDMIGQSPAMQKVYRTIKKIAPTDGKVMIFGENGTGKQKVAEAIHNNSLRKGKAFEILNCNPQSTDLTESELFGHVKGAFTGTVADRRGLFEKADGGTLFLDEIGDLAPFTQVKILRVIENGEFTKLGSEKVQKTNVRLLSATHKNLEEMVDKGTFRQDLYYRLYGIRIELPPLRERREDIPLLIEKHKCKFILNAELSPKIFDPKAVKILTDFDWPGNVRYLLSTVENLILLAESDIILAEDVMEALQIQTSPASSLENPLSLSQMTRSFEKSRIIEYLKKNDFNISAAARDAKMDRANFRKKIKNYDIAIPR